MTNIIRKIYKITLALIVVQIIFAIGTISEAGWWDDVLSSGDSFLGIGKDAASSGSITTNGNVTISTPSDSDLQVIINDIYGILFPLAVGITVIIGGVLGIKFMIASAEDKAKIKESMIPYVVGCIVIYGAFGIWKLAITIFSVLG